MWEKISKCMRGGKKSNGCGVDLSELQKRVPPNQMKQFRIFAKQHEEYKSRLSKYPTELPKIDWEYYRTNVRKDMVKWVADFEKKYDKLDSMFVNRHSMIDSSKYFGEVIEQTKQVEKDIKEYKKCSDELIAELEERMKYVKGMKPYVEMTMEEYCLARPEEAPDFINKPTFWPHTPEEQKPGPGEEVSHDDDHGEEKKEAKPDPKDPPKTPPTTPAGDKAPPVPADAKAAPKDPKASTDTKKEAAKPEVKPEPQKESQAVEKMSELASKGIAFTKELLGKAVVMLKSAWQNITSKKKTTSEPPKATYSSGSTQTKPDTEDSIRTRETTSNICNKTIIRGEKKANADVKEHHKDLDIEGEEKEDVCKPDPCKKQKPDPCEKEEPDPCECEEEKKPKLKCEDLLEKGRKDDDCVCKPEPNCEEKKDPCKKKDTDVTDVDGKKSFVVGQLQSAEATKSIYEEPSAVCKHVIQGSSSQDIFVQENERKIAYQTTRVGQPVNVLKDTSDNSGSKALENIFECQDSEKSDAIGPLKKEDAEQSDPHGPETKALSTQPQNFGFQATCEPMQALHEYVDKQKQSEIVMNILKKKKQEFPLRSEADTSKETPKRIKPTPALQGLVVRKVDPAPKAKPLPTSTTMEPICSKDDEKTPSPTKMGEAHLEELGKRIFEAATSAASLLSEAKKTIAKAQNELSSNKDVQEAYELAQQMVIEALAKATVALESAKSLAKQTGLDKEIASLIERHTLLAQLMVSRAIALKNEIAKLLSDLRSK